MRSLFALSRFFIGLFVISLLEKRLTYVFFVMSPFQSCTWIIQVLICKELDFDLHKLLIHSEINVFFSSKGFLDAFSRK